MPPSVRPTSVKATLIVVPAALLSQWIEEAQKHSPSLKVLVWSARQEWTKISIEERRAYAKWAFGEADIIMTTYESLQLDLRLSKRKEGASPILQVQWYRVILDEAQLVAKSSSQAAIICSELWRMSGWVVTGTPITNIGDVSFSRGLLRSYLCY